MSASLLVLNGPNLNMLGAREPEIYGAQTLADIESLCVAQANALGAAVDFRQTNSEGELITWVQDARGAFDGLIINAGAYTHTSVALLDAVSAAELPCIEVHLSNIHQREDFRHVSYLSQAAAGMICGLGADGYLFAIQALVKRLHP